jgi:hypothetical protein
MLIAQLKLNKIVDEIVLKLVCCHQVKSKVSNKTVIKTLLSDGKDKLCITEWNTSLFSGFIQDEELVLTKFMPTAASNNTAYVQLNDNEIE